MSTSLLLPCSPSPRRTSAAERTAPLNRAPPLISLGSFSPYTGCQGPSKTPLLKSRRPSPQPLVLPHSPSENNLSFTPSAVGINFREVAFSAAPFRDLSPTKQVLLPLNSSPRREISPPNRRLYLEESLASKEFSQPRKTFIPNPKVAPKTFSESSSSLSPLSPISPLSPNIPTFPCRLPSPSSPTYANPQKSYLKKSQSTLIMPSLLTLLRPEPAPASPLPRDTSSRSLNDSSLPSPLIRKCHTMVSLSGSANGGIHATTKAMKDKKTRFGFLRRISSSKSAVFASTKSSSSLQTPVLRKSPSAALQRYRKTSGGMWPHPEHPEEGKPIDEGYEEKSPDDSEVPAGDERVWSNGGGCSRCASASSIPSRRQSTVVNDAVFCKLCLTDVSIREMYQLQQCQCRFCTYCMCMYTTLKIREGEAAIECPDSNCDCRGDLALDEVESLVGKELLNLHLRFRRDREIESDPLKTWCPKPGCDTVVSLSVSKLDGRPQCCSCTTCSTLFCASCSNPWHPGKPCNRVVAQLGVPLNDAIKRCPRCKVPIERDAGCAQMQCKKCKHVFCWYCLASLEDDFLLRHYDKGPCKNKLGHSRASVLWHRAQVVVIFAGFGLLLVIASPLLLFVGPCLLCRSCRPCSSSSSSSSGSRQDSEEGHTGL